MWLCTDDVHHLWKYILKKDPFFFVRSNNLILVFPHFVVCQVWRWRVSTVDSAFLSFWWLPDDKNGSSHDPTWGSEAVTVTATLFRWKSWKSPRVIYALIKSFKDLLYFFIRGWWSQSDEWNVSSQASTWGSTICDNLSCHNRPVQVEAWEEPHLWLEQVQAARLRGVPSH